MYNDLPGPGSFVEIGEKRICISPLGLRAPSLAAESSRLT